ncbi:MAG: DNA mismatch repair endonuclease MutL [Oscillospiraceae bacterium]|nr:DNA mismatch repair endonuclease MutL [Oscillospiraceae bacterium]
MPKILQLSAHVADMIAAGEVVERPASVVKELLENAIDAGSSRIDVAIENGGMTLIRVSDDGCGIADGDAETAFLRHATSKIRDAGDLEHIRTLGFRGEALAATAAVSRIELLTKTADAEIGTRLLLDGGAVRLHEETGCPNGTTILVRDLFYNTPARMKFMKRDSVEASAVLGAVQQQALAHPEIALRFFKDGQQALSTDGSGDLCAAIYQVLGRQFAQGLSEVHGTWDRFAISGFVTRPTESHGNRSHQLFFVNGRCVKSRLLTSALEEAYRNQIMVGRFPGCVLMLTVPEDTVDVNVHPAKTEVKFLSERDIFDCVRYGVEAALRQTPGKIEARLPQQQPIPQPQQTAAPAPKKDFYRTMNAADYKAFLQQLGKNAVTASPAVAKTVLQKDEQIVADQVELPLPVSHAPQPEPPKETKQPDDAPWRIIGEVLSTYIIVEQGEDVYFMDKHAAHERILFEKYKAQQQPIAIQTLLAPVSASLTPEEASAALENLALLETFGFELEDFGDDTVLIRGIPADLDPEQAQAALSEAAADLLAGKHLRAEDLRDNLLHTVACKAAIKAGWHTDPLERQKLVDEVFSRDDLKYCPHGRPICIKLTKSALEQQFGRA